MKQPDLYYFKAIKMTSQAWSNFVWGIRAAGEYSSVNFDQACDVILWLQNSLDQAVS